MLIRVEDIKDEGLILEAEEAAEKFPALAELGAAGECVFPGALQIHLRVQRVREMVEVEGTAETEVKLVCSRCLTEFAQPVTTRFALTFTEELPQFEGEDEEEVELSAEDMGLSLFDGEEIDLRDAIAEQVIMSLPLRPLCSEGCKGLCQFCGADLNEGDCGCQPSPFNAKFDALKAFKVGKTE